MRWQDGWLIGALVVGFGVAGCGGEEASKPTEEAPEEEAAGITYYQDIKPIMDAYCVSCHQPGGLGVFPLTTLEEVRAFGGVIGPAVSERRMPPFLAAPAVRPLRFDVSLSTAQIALVEEWLEGGMKAGDAGAPGEVLEVPRGSLGRVDRVVGMGAPYTPAVGGDEYRCFVIPWPEAEVRYITGYEVRPGNEEIAHHAAIFLVEGEEGVGIVDAADGVDGRGAGYGCFGSAAPPGGEGLPNKLVAAWTPGGGGVDFPAGTGIRVKPGARMILQVHYSTAGSAGGSDQTEVALRLDASVERNAGNLPWLNLMWPSNPASMTIPAGMSEVVHEHLADPTRSPLFGEFVPGVDPSQGLMLYGVLPHMHRLGKAFTLQVERPDGTVEPLLEIRAWDFDWQGYYLFEEPVKLAPGERLRMRCVFDNSAAYQPVIGGVQQEPRELYWGEGTADEMCTASMYVHGLVEAREACPGSEEAAEGRFEVTFDTEDRLRTSAMLDGEFRGPVSGSIYRAEDVTLSGPKEGAEPVAGFDFEEIDLRTGSDGPHLLDAVLPAGEYQFLGYMDTDGNAAESEGPDLNDPIMIPVRASVMECAVQRVVVEFPLLLPRL